MLVAYIGTWWGVVALHNVPIARTEVIGTWEDESTQGTLTFHDDGTVDMRNFVIPQGQTGTDDLRIESEAANWQVSGTANKLIVVREDGSGFSLHSARTPFALGLAVRADVDPSPDDLMFVRE
ncbi:hypothetical protein JOE59_000913 [Agromyces cerinus]|uniref:hypothetical protein n=1 Tax=Agromyces cerinus TaxID=33878 RepID=UPI00195AC64A|nr:hypothetical protein [Agromyces cerinus]MBM7830208.1 hypothetical protein [Agromyces cerinus]